VALKGQCVITTQEILDKVKAAEEATRARKVPKGRGRRKSAPSALESHVGDEEGVEEADNDEI
jgi:hypothetical protein